MAIPCEAIHGAVGLRVRMIREALGMDQTTLASKTRLTRTSITNIEAGRQRLQLHTVEELARALNTTTKHLLKGIWW
jgi:transcriptional regulator with XRE-family HTH domain